MMRLWSWLVRNETRILQGFIVIAVLVMLLLVD